MNACGVRDGLSGDMLASSQRNLVIWIFFEVFQIMEAISGQTTRASLIDSNSEVKAKCLNVRLFKYMYLAN